MGDILGLGITHYPGLSYKGNLTSRIKVLLADPLLPERLRSPEGWHPTMREQWGTDEGGRHSEKHRNDLIHYFRKARAELDAFEPDFVLLWGEFVAPAALRKNVKGMLSFAAPLLWNISVE